MITAVSEGTPEDADQLRDSRTKIRVFAEYRSDTGVNVIRSSVALGNRVESSIRIKCLLQSHEHVSLLSTHARKRNTRRINGLVDELHRAVNGLGGSRDGICPR